MNKIILIGRLTKDPDLRYTQNGAAVCTFTLAVNRPYAKDGEVMLRVTARAHTKQEAEEMTAPVVQSLCERFSQYIYGVDVGDLQTAAVRALTEKGLKAACAESYLQIISARKGVHVQNFARKI